MTMTRTEIEALLPFLANGTLEGAERDEVEAAVAEDAGLQSELAAIGAIRTRMQAEEMEASPGELGLARLMRDIDREVQDAPTEPAALPDNVVPIGRLRMWQVAAALILAVGLGQAVLTQGGPGAEADLRREVAIQDTPQAEEAPQAEAEAAADFALAGAQPMDPPIAAFRVIFDAEATEGDIRALLLEAGVQIVAGPTSLGFYDLAPPDGDAGMDAARTALEGAGSLIDVLEESRN